MAAALRGAASAPRHHHREVRAAPSVADVRISSLIFVRPPSLTPLPSARRRLSLRFWQGALTCPKGVVACQLQRRGRGGWRVDAAAAGGSGGKRLVHAAAAAHCRRGHYYYCCCCCSCCYCYCSYCCCCYCSCSSCCCCCCSCSSCCCYYCCGCCGCTSVGARRGGQRAAARRHGHGRVAPGMDTMFALS